MTSGLAISITRELLYSGVGSVGVVVMRDIVGRRSPRGKSGGLSLQGGSGERFNGLGSSLNFQETLNTSMGVQRSRVLGERLHLDGDRWCILLR